MRLPAIYFVNASDYPDITKALPDIVHALGVQQSEDVQPAWGRTLPGLLTGGTKPDGAMPCTIRNLLDVPDALGYHDNGSDGPFIEISAGLIFQTGGTISEGSNSVSATLSHELLELIGDASANRWDDAPDGYDYAEELCDAVEGDSYTVSGIAVSDFVYPAFFDPFAPSDEKKDHLGLVTRPFETRPAGYQIRRTEPGRITQVFAEDARTARLPHFQRGVHLVFGDEFPDWKKRAKLKSPRLAKRAKDRGGLDWLREQESKASAK